MKSIRRLCASVLSGVMLVTSVSPLGILPSNHAFASDQAFSNPTFNVFDTNSDDIGVDDSALRVRYGQYLETELHLRGTPTNAIVDWDIVGAGLPEGIQLEETSSSSPYLFGTPQFTGQWCFKIVARANTGKQAFREICFDSEESENAPYPVFTTGRFLQSAVAGQMYQQDIELFQNENDFGTLNGEVVESTLPDGLEIVFNGHDRRFQVRGRTSEVGTFTFAVKVQNQFGFSNAHQFVVIVDADRTPGAGQEVQCPAGYYFDSDLGYCIQAVAELCPSGTYYEPSVNQCVQYPAAPPTIRCSVGYYFDHFLSQCVPNYAQRCPLNYRWDNSSDRCVRTSYHCGIGYSYDIFIGTCVSIWRTSCAPGFYFDAYRNSCVRNYGSCSYGYYHDPYAMRCAPSPRIRNCGHGEIYHPGANRCITRPISGPNGRFCSPGTYYDPYFARCERRVPPPSSCGYGSHHSPAHGGCVPNRPVPPPVRPRPLPPRPLPGQPPRPGYPGYPGNPPRPQPPMDRPYPPRPQPPMDRPYPPRPQPPMDRPYPPRPQPPMDRPYPPRPQPPMDRPYPPRPQPPMDRPYPPSRPTHPGGGGAGGRPPRDTPRPRPPR